MNNITTIMKKNKGIILLFIGLLLGAFLLFYDWAPSQQNTTELNYSDFIELYTDKTESKLESLINKINGVSNAEVMVILKSGSEYIYASDDSDTSEKHVIVDNGLVYVKEYLPEIEGVAIVCSGGSDAVIKEKVTELVCSVLGLYSTHVYVTE